MISSISRKLESGRMSLSVESDDVASVVSNCIMIVEPLVKQKGLKLVQEIQPNLPTLMTDIVKIRQIIVNLLSNASKFTEKGEILVKAWENNGMISFAVKDSGIGIDKKNHSLVFEEFQQVDNSSTRKYKGTGLGLPIARKLARLLGGDLALESEIGKGSTFTLTIPPTLPPQAQEPVRKPLPRPAPAPAPAALPLGQTARQVQTVTPKGVQILCIDDDPDVIEILRKYLVPEGYSVVGALSGDEGIEMAAKTKPALITLDIMMPKKDGWQVLRELKQQRDKGYTGYHSFRGRQQAACAVPRGGRRHHEADRTETPLFSGETLLPDRRSDLSLSWMTTRTLPLHSRLC